ncbi:MAG: patatin-like phospholipase family protein [Acidimicrobiia bacterium]
MRATSADTPDGDDVEHLGKGSVVVPSEMSDKGVKVRSGRIELRLGGALDPIAWLGPGSALGDLRPLLEAGIPVTAVVVSERAELVPLAGAAPDDPTLRVGTSRRTSIAPRVTAVFGAALTELASLLERSGNEVRLARLPGAPQLPGMSEEELTGERLLGALEEPWPAPPGRGAPHLLLALPEIPTGDALRAVERAHVVLAEARAPRWLSTRGTGRPVLRMRAGEGVPPRVVRFAEGRAVGLALSGGGSKAVAHIGVIAVLREHGIEIDAVAGTSGGALVGAAVAFHRTCDRMMGMVRELASATRLRRFDYHLVPRSAIFKGVRLRSLFESWYPGEAFTDSEIPFWAVASDLLTGEEVVIDTGPISDGLRASMSLPGILDPWPLDGRRLLDGVAVNPLPASVLRAAGAGVVIGSDVASGVGAPGSSESPHLLRMVSRMMHSMEREMIKSQLGLIDVLVATRMRAVHSFDFSRAEEFAAHGAAEARERLPDLLRVLGGDAGGLSPAP